LGVSIAPGDYNFTNQQIWISTDPSVVVNLNGIYSWGNYFNGKLNSGNWNFQFAPIPQVSITVRYNRNHFRGVGEPKITTKVDLYGIEGRFALNPRLQMTGFYQKNSANNADNYNLSLAWEYEPLSYLYLVFNHSRFTNVQAKRKLKII